MGCILAIRHVMFEDLGHFATVWAHRHDIAYAAAWDVDWQAVSAAPPDMLVILGGPIGVYDTNAYPFLTAEIDAVRQRIAAGLPTLGVCLGAQIIAASQGSRVYPAGVKEIGFAPLRLTDAGRRSVLHPYADEPDAFHWHGDTFDLPGHATLLASTDAVTNQAFAIGDHVLAFQFHPEVMTRAIEPWLVGHAIELLQAGVAVADLRADAHNKDAAMAAKSCRVASAIAQQFNLKD